MTETLHAITELITATKGHDAVGMLILGLVFGTFSYLGFGKIADGFKAVATQIEDLKDEIGGDIKDVASEVKLLTGEVSELKNRVVIIEEGMHWTKDQVKTNTARIEACFKNSNHF